MISAANQAAPVRRAGTGPIDHLVVAIPARDERTTIADCLRSIDIAAAAAGVPTHIVVAADTCSDDTAAVADHTALQHSSVSVLEGRWGAAGAARRAAVDAGLAVLTGHADDIAAERVWIANTDADTTVPPTWLSDQLRLAARHQAIAGVVDLDERHVSTALLHRFRSTYRTDGDRHQHVHGANLGVRADVYCGVGGWCPDTVVGEDHGLWRRILDTGASVVQSSAVRVVTSGRTTSRVEGGFASDLRMLVTPAFAGADVVDLDDSDCEELVA